MTTSSLIGGQVAEAAGDFVAASVAYRALIAAPDEPVAAEARFLLGRVSWRQGRLDAALASYESARALAEGLHDTELHARIDNGIGAVHYARGDYAAARRAYAAAESRTADHVLKGKVLLNLGVIESIEGHNERAHDHYHRAFLLFEQHDDVASATLALYNRGLVESELLRWADADASFTAALRLATDAENRELVARTLVNRSEVLVELGALNDAVASCDQAVAIYAAIGDDVGRGEALRWRAHALGRAGDHAGAERNASEALHIAMRSGTRLLEAQSARDVGVLRGLMGDRAGGVKELRRALALFTDLGKRTDAAEIGVLLSRPTPNRPLHRILLDDDV